MSSERDTILLETARTHRARLASAFLHGRLSERRVLVDNTRRFLGSVVLAAVIAAGCVVGALVGDFVAQQQAERAAREAPPAAVTPSPPLAPAPPATDPGAP